MAFCEQCGAALSGGGGACERCGRLRVQPAAPERLAPAPQAPPPPPGYELVGGAGAAAPPPAFAAATPTRAFAPARNGFLVAIPPLAALAAIFGATAYPTVYDLIRWGEIGTLDSFLTGAGPGVLSYIPSGGGDITYGLPGTALALIMTLLATVILASLSRASAGRRLLAGALVSVVAAILAGALVLVNHSLPYAYYPLGEQLTKSVVGAAIVGLVGGLLGALLSLAVRRPPAPNFP